MFHARTKHVGGHYRYIRKKVLRGEINKEYTKTEDQVVDIFTKVLSYAKFKADSGC